MNSRDKPRVYVTTSSFPQYDSDYAGKNVYNAIVPLSKRYERCFEEDIDIAVVMDGDA